MTKKDYFYYDILYVILFTVLGFFLTKIFVDYAFAEEKQKYTELRVFNVYRSVSLKLEVKCDFVSKEKGYKFYQIVKVPRNSSIVIKAPWGLRECQIWPLGIEFF